MPSVFAVGTELIGNAALAMFAAFGSFAMLATVDFRGSTRVRLQDAAWLGVAGGALICAGTLASHPPLLAAAVTALVGFGVLFSGVISSVLAGATTSLLLAFILSVSLSAPVAEIPDRLAGWGMAVGAALPAIAWLWPAPQRDPVRTAAIAACRAQAARLRTPARPGGAVEALEAVFFTTPYRPTGLSTTARAVVRLVDELRWLDAIALDPGGSAVQRAAARVLERGADLLDGPRRPPEPLHAAMDELRAALAELQGSVTRAPTVAVLEASFRAQRLSFVVLQLATNIDFAAAADRRGWLAQLLGRPPAELGGRLSAAGERAGSHVRRHSVWLQNSVRGGAGLGLAVALASVSGVQHAFWVVLGALAVLRSNALSTGQSVLRGLLGTTAGFVVGALVVTLIGDDRALLWVLLPPAVLLAGLAPTAVSFAGGQAAFTLTVVILFNITGPGDWRVGLTRVEDVALGGAASLAVGLLFWPRGAGGALGKALAAAYADSARYLAEAVRFGAGRCDAAAPPVPAPTAEAVRAAASARRLDDAFRTFLAERGAKRLPLAEATSLTTGVVALRLAADAVLDLWRDCEPAPGDRDAARRELLAAAERMTRWYDTFAAALAEGRPVPAPAPAEPGARERLVAAVDHDLRGADGQATAAAVRLLWTGDHLEAARRLEGTLADSQGGSSDAQPLLKATPPPPRLVT